jgi:hypothetical protein
VLHTAGFLGTAALPMWRAGRIKDTN